ncbi:hydantoinase B/oxoprolinase family protein [Thermodesulfobacteriota bacterium]
MVDPIVLEIVNNRLQQIGLQAGYTLLNTAASTVVVHAKDLGFNISDHLGQCVVYSMWMPRHGTNLSYILRACKKSFQERIYPGDMFITNSPHAGALHNQDIAIISPIFYGEELVAWTGCATHHLDIGAMNPGRAFLATDFFQEGIIIPPMKIMENYEIKQEVMNLFLENVRVPQLQGLDLKGQIASNNVAREKILELVKRYGVETIKGCYKEIIDFSEEKALERIAMLPKGRYEATDYISCDGIYTVKCILEVKEDNLTFDFTGTDGQTNTFINSALPCTVSNVHNIVVCLLTPDIPVNEGCLRPINVVVPEENLLNCTPPAPCSGSSVISGWTAMSLAVRTLSLALAGSEESWRANASWPTGHIGLMMGGKDKKGKISYSASLTQEVMGGGARGNKDGLNFASAPGSTTTSRLNVEEVESRCPTLTLYTRSFPDSGGAGKFRGGVGVESVFKMHGADQAEAIFFWTGRGVAANGIFQGKPGTTPLLAVKNDTDILKLLPRGLPSWEDIAGEEKILPGRPPPFPLGERDVVLMRNSGGGGYGNPLDRDPRLVLKDVLDGYVSLEKAEEDYDVVIDREFGTIDEKATEVLRKRNRKAKDAIPDSQAAILTDEISQD